MIALQMSSETSLCSLMKIQTLLFVCRSRVHLKNPATVCNNTGGADKKRRQQQYLVMPVSSDNYAHHL